MTEWRDIGSAPHGRLVRIYAYEELSPGHIRFHTTEGYLPGDGGGWIAKDLPSGSVVTHWKPLPHNGIEP